MSTATKRKIEQAWSDAECVRDLFKGCYDHWEIAGSIRRGKPEVGDVEHVVIPKVEDVPNPLAMFGETVRMNLVWARAEELLESDVIEKHEYVNHRADGTTFINHRWGENYRGINFNGFNHEIFCATPENFGCILTIRTGPADFSQRMVTALHGTLLRQQDGYLKYADGKVYACPDERTFFAACRAEWKEPRDR